MAGIFDTVKNISSGIKNAANDVTEFTRKFNSPETIGSLLGGRLSNNSGLRYPLQTEYPAYIQYRVREVIPAANIGAASLISAFKSDVPVVSAGGVSNSYAAQTSVVNTDTTTSSQKVDAVLSRDRDGIGAPKETSKQVDSVLSRDRDGLGASKSTSTAKRIADAKAVTSTRIANSGGTGGATSGLLGFKTVYKQPAVDIKMYFPQAIQMNDNIQYDQQNLGMAGAVGLAALNSGASIGSAIGAAAMETGKSLMSLFGMGNSGVGTEAARLAAAKAAETANSAVGIPAGAQAALSLALQVKVNPSTRSIFTGVTVRNFQFTYDFYARSKEEADMVNKIIKTFRTVMYPRAIPESAYAAGLPLGYRFPDLFEIKFKFGGQNMQIPQPLYCFLRDVSTTYNPGSMSFHEDGNPTHIQMSLSFQEFRALNQQDIEKGH